MSYGAFRVEGYPTLYPDNKSPVYNDILVYGIIFCFCILGFSFLVVIPGVRGIQRLYVTIRIFTSLIIGAFILVSNFGQEFEVARLKHTTTQYKAFTDKEISASITVKIGLRSVNITLLGLPPNQLNETINYNERFSWEWAQGRNGFGPQAGRIQREFRAAQVKGLPYPILWIAEYFTFDGEGMRYGRHYRTAGWYSHIMLWLAFSLWVLSNILFMMVVRYGAFYLFLTGCSLLIANILFASIRNFLPLEIPFESGVLKFSYGWSFHLTLFTGLLCVCLGIVIFILDHREPDFIATFFGLDVLQDYEEFYADPEDLKPKHDKGVPEISDNNRSQEIPQEHPDVYGLRKRTFSERLQRKPTRGPANAATSSGNPPAVPPRGKMFSNPSYDEGDPVYENIALHRCDPIGEEDESTDKPVNDDYTTVLVA